MDLERSDGKIIQNPDAAVLDEVIAGIGKEYEHCILSDGDAFVQTAGSVGSLLLQYSDGQGMYESVRSDLEVSTVQDVFRQFLAHQNSWQTSIDFSPMDGGPAAGAASGSGAGGRGASDSEQGETSHGEKSFADSLKDSVKKEAMNSVNRAARKITRNVFRKFF